MNLKGTIALEKISNFFPPQLHLTRFPAGWCQLMVMLTSRSTSCPWPQRLALTAPIAPLSSKAWRALFPKTSRTPSLFSEGVAVLGGTLQQLPLDDFHGGPFQLVSLF